MAAQPQGGSTITVLEENEDARVFNDEEIREYAEFLGIDWDEEPHLVWIAREGVAAPVPPPWKACTQNSDDIFYFNFETGESVWEHPCDDKYRRKVQEEREKFNRELALNTEQPPAEAPAPGLVQAQPELPASQLVPQVAQLTEATAQPAQPEQPRQREQAQPADAASAPATIAPTQEAHEEAESQEQHLPDFRAERSLDEESLSGTLSMSGRAKATFPLPSSLLSPSEASASGTGRRGIPEDDDFNNSQSSSLIADTSARDQQHEVIENKEQISRSSQQSLGQSDGRNASPQDQAGASSVQAPVQSGDSSTSQQGARCHPEIAEASEVSGSEPPTPEASSQSGNVMNAGVIRSRQTGPEVEADETWSAASTPVARTSGYRRYGSFTIPINEQDTDSRPASAAVGAGADSFSAPAQQPYQSQPPQVQPPREQVQTQPHAQTEHPRQLQQPQAQPTVVSTATPRGLAGVGLAGAGLADDATLAAAAPENGGSATAAAPQQGSPVAAEPADRSASLESVSRGSVPGNSGSNPMALPKRKGLDHYDASVGAASEISEDLVSGCSSSMTDAKDRRPPSMDGQGDTLELSISASDFKELSGQSQTAAQGAPAQNPQRTLNAFAMSADARPGSVAPMFSAAAQARLEAKLASLTRSLELMRDIRVKQEQRLRLLQGRAL